MTAAPPMRARTAARLLLWPTGSRGWDLEGDVVTVGRSPAADVRLDDPQVSRLHARLERVAGRWTVVDDGLSRNGTWVDGRRVHGRVALHDRDELRVGGTLLRFRDPEDGADPSTVVADPLLTPARLTPAQRAVLAELVRPYAAGGPVAAPASNADIAAALHLSVETVKSHLRALCLRLGIEHLPPAQKRLRLVELALRGGLVQLHDLRA